MRTQTIVISLVLLNATLAMSIVNLDFDNLLSITFGIAAVLVNFASLIGLINILISKGFAVPIAVGLAFLFNVFGLALAYFAVQTDENGEIVLMRFLR